MQSKRYMSSRILPSCIIRLWNTSSFSQRSATLVWLSFLALITRSLASRITVASADICPRFLALALSCLKSALIKFSTGFLDPAAAVARSRMRRPLFSKNFLVTFVVSSLWGALHFRLNSIPFATTAWHFVHGNEPSGYGSSSPASVVSRKINKGIPLVQSLEAFLEDAQPEKGGVGLPEADSIITLKQVNHIADLGIKFSSGQMFMRNCLDELRQVASLGVSVQVVGKVDTGGCIRNMVEEVLREIVEGGETKAVRISEIASGIEAVSGEEVPFPLDLPKRGAVNQVDAIGRYAEKGYEEILVKSLHGSSVFKNDTSREEWVGSVKVASGMADGREILTRRGVKFFNPYRPVRYLCVVEALKRLRRAADAERVQVQNVLQRAAEDWRGFSFVPSNWGDRVGEADRIEADFTTGTLPLGSLRPEPYKQLLDAQLEKAPGLMASANTMLALPVGIPVATLEYRESLLGRVVAFVRCFHLFPGIQWQKVSPLGRDVIPHLRRAFLGVAIHDTAASLSLLFSKIHELPGVKAGQFVSILRYQDRDFWIGAILQAFEEHVEGHAHRASDLPVYIGAQTGQLCGFDFQVNVPIAAAVCALAYLAEVFPTPDSPFRHDYHKMGKGAPTQVLLDKWRANLPSSLTSETLQTAQRQADLTRYTRVGFWHYMELGQSLRSHTHDHSPFDPSGEPANYLDALRLLFAGLIPVRQLEASWAYKHLIWPEHWVETTIALPNLLSDVPPRKKSRGLHGGSAVVPPRRATAPAGLPLQRCSVEIEEAVLEEDTDDEPEPMDFSLYRAASAEAILAIDLHRDFVVPDIGQVAYEALTKKGPKCQPASPQKTGSDWKLDDWALRDGLSGNRRRQLNDLSPCWYALYDFHSKRHLPIPYQVFEQQYSSEERSVVSKGQKMMAVGYAFFQRCPLSVHSTASLSTSTRSASSGGAAECLASHFALGLHLAAN
ncbi:unnamed protein product, partial [Symbiodinium necroappetens]